MENQMLVTIDVSALHALAQELADQELTAPEWREPWYPQGDDETFVQFLGVANALNFCYTEPGQEKFAVEWNGMLLPGSAGLMAALMRAREEGTDILDAAVLERLTPDAIDWIFRSDAGPLPLMPYRDTHLRSLGRELIHDADGSFFTFFEGCGFDAEAIITMLPKTFTAYAGDADRLASGQLFRFDKRARLLHSQPSQNCRCSGKRMPSGR